MPGGDAAYLDGLIGRVDPDRWLTSRFIAHSAARDDVLALYAFDHELARARRAASTPLMAEIRLAWWREVLDEVFDGEAVRRHPTAQALAAAVARRGLVRAPLEAMIDAQIEALDSVEFDADAAVRWADAVQGGVASLAASALDPASPASAVAAAGRAWGLALLVRGGRIERTAVAAPWRSALAEARAASRTLSVAALPAALPARLARYDFAGVTPGPLRKRLALIVAAATGRV
ncbi:MAG TPA: squalene/phytoene synthase family protein [Caulobacteraceae bacterium]|nr:squalene/phytoene synthase family protein [Caulobacteraceae bacterium]